MRNWRPIFLLNIDFKILSKCLANSSKNAWKQLFIKIRRVVSKADPFLKTFSHKMFIFYANQYNKLLAIISVDQSKAFDRLNHNSLQKNFQ